jgi:Rrf2 family protein
MLSQTAEYALRAALYLAREENGRAVPADRIAHALGAPANYLSKTLNAMARAGILAGLRGPNGGFRLIRDPALLTVADVVGTFDEPQQRPMCLLGGRPCAAMDPCEAHTRWALVRRAMREPLTSTTVTDLLNDAEPLEAAV